MPTIPGLTPGLAIQNLPHGAASIDDAIKAMVVTPQRPTDDPPPTISLAYVDPTSVDSDTPKGRRVLIVADVQGVDSPVYPITAERGQFTGVELPV